MWMDLQGVVGTGTGALDGGITDMVVRVTDQGTFLYTNSGRNGGLVAYRIEPDGAISVRSTVVYPPNLTGAAGDQLVLGITANGPALYVAGNNNGLVGYRLNADGSLGGTQALGWADARASAANGGQGIVDAWVAHGNQGLNLFPDSYSHADVVALGDATVGGRQFVVVACAAGNSVTCFQRDPQTGRLIEVDVIGAAQGLGISAPTAMELVEINGETFVILAAAGTSTLTVMRLGSDGSLTPTDHIMDTGSTRFAGVQSVATAVAGDFAFVVAGGADDGLTLFMLLPDGSLVFLQAIADSGATSLRDVTSVSMQVVGNRLHIFAASEDEAGLTHLTIPLTDLGIVRTGRANQAEVVAGSQRNDILIAGANNDTLSGGEGDDVLVAGPGQTWMRGGAGHDIFVMREGSGLTRVLDFEVGIDRLDMSDLPMLRDTGQLVFVTVAAGARIEYRGQVFYINSSDGSPLRLRDVFPDGFEGADRIPVILIDEDEHGNQRLRGTAGNDVLRGGSGNDTINGAGGNDRLFGEAGDNLLLGRAGNDTIHGGTGNDTVRGGGGNDLIYGTAGDNRLLGGAGNDIIHGGSGNDTIRGGAGNDRLVAGGGDNVIAGGAGNDTIYGGAGHDRLIGGSGDDLIYGGSGNDLVKGGGGRDTLWGGTGDDTINGGGGADVLHGGPGADLIRGGGGNDRLYGDQGNDTLIGGKGNDLLFGGAGADTFVFARNHDRNRVMDFNPLDGDMLHLNANLWRHVGDLNVRQVVNRFASVNDDGSVVLDFGNRGGTVIVLDGFDDLRNLTDHIMIV